MICRRGKKEVKWVTGPPPIDPKKIYINPEMEDQMTIEGYRLNRWKRALTYLAILITVGLLRLVFYWLPHWMLRCTHSKCSLAKAETVLLQDQYMQWFVADVIIMRRDGKGIKASKQWPVLKFRKEESDNTQNNSNGNMEENFMDEEEGSSPLLSLPEKENESLNKYFMVKKVKYIWNKDCEKFVKMMGLEENTFCSYFHESEGLSYTEQCKKRLIYGINSIDVHVTPVVTLLFKEVLSPFYVFQAFSISVWCAEDYYYYAACIFLISSVSITITIYQTRKNQRALRNTIHSSNIVSVCRGNDRKETRRIYEDLQSEDLVPGDLIEIPRSGCVMQCDAVLVSGNCIINESMLTGESIPVTKTPLPNPKLSGNSGDIKFCMKEHSRHVLFCGTNVIQTRYYGNQKVRAVVIRTGFHTAKGELVRSILYPKPVDFKFEQDTYKFVGVLAGIAMVGFIYSIIMDINIGEDFKDIVLHSLDIITIAVPPALPAALAVGIVFAQRRLKLDGIYCISPRSINICGSINAVCFDKTGTLTEDGLMLQGVVPVSKGEFQDEITNLNQIQDTSVLVSMATCHSLTIIDGKLNGDPLDLIMFESTGWELEEPGAEQTRFDMLVPTVVHPRSRPDVVKDAYDLPDLDKSAAEEIGIVRQFTFSSSLQRMSVICRKLGGQNFELYTKGAPEMVVSLSQSDTVPHNFHDVLSQYTQHGYRVLALAWKPLSSKVNYVKIQRIQREQVERDLIFLGLVIMENKLKPQTLPVIHELLDANIRTIMVTGDNMLTALSVARECGMVQPQDNIILAEALMPPGGSAQPKLEFIYAEDMKKLVEEVTHEKNSMKILIDEANPRFHFAVSGKSFAIIREYFPEVMSKIAVRGTVFSRMSPDQKAQLVEVLQKLGYYVGMCGDGANDCGALKSAHAGISLSQAEASVASPFTSKTSNIECVPNVIREGRCALTTSFGIFKYMACYSLTQFVSVCLLYWIGANLTDFEYLYIDLFLLSTLSISFGRTAPYPVLAKEPPAVSLTSVFPIMTLIVQMGIQMGVQVLCFLHVQEQPWFTPYVENDEDDYRSYENSAVFYICMFQYITLAITFAKGPPYRKTMFTNYLFLLNVILCTGISLWIVLAPIESLSTFLELKTIESFTYRLLFIGIALANLFASVLVETYFLDNATVRQKCLHLAEKCLPASQYEYHTIEQELKNTPDWPPVSSDTSGLGELLREHSIYSVDAKDTDMLLSADSDPENVDTDSDWKKSDQNLKSSCQVVTAEDNFKEESVLLLHDHSVNCETDYKTSHAEVMGQKSLGANHADDAKVKYGYSDKVNGT